MIPIDKRVRTLKIADGKMYTVSVRISNEHDDWHTIHLTDDEVSASESKRSMEQGLKVACEAMRERCAEVADSALRKSVGGSGGIESEATFIGDTIRELEI